MTRGLFFLRFTVFVILIFLIASCSKDNELPPPNPDPKFDSTLVIGGKQYTIDSVKSIKIDNGINYFACKLKNTEFPLVFYTLEFEVNNSGYNIQAWKGKDSYNGLERPSAVSKRKSNEIQQVIMALNGGFYGMADGTPVGVQIVNSLMINSPRFSEPDPAIGFDEKGIPYIDNVTMKSKATSGSKIYNITKVNRPRLENDLVLYNSFFGSNTKTNEWGSELLLKPIDGEWGKLTNYKNVKLVVEKKVLVAEGKSMSIPEGKIVLSGHGKGNDFLSSISVGDELIVDMDIAFNVSNVKIKNMISTHNIILKGGIKSNLIDDIAVGRHPRTAVGYNADKSKVYFIVVDGRSDASKGVTTKELADIFIYWKASDAVNLDGGGSSCMVLNNSIVNNPSDKSERAVSDGLLIMKQK